MLKALLQPAAKAKRPARSLRSGAVYWLLIPTLLALAAAGAQAAFENYDPHSSVIESGVASFDTLYTDSHELPTDSSGEVHASQSPSSSTLSNSDNDTLGFDSNTAFTAHLNEAFAARAPPEFRSQKPNVFVF